MSVFRYMQITLIVLFSVIALPLAGYPVNRMLFGVIVASFLVPLTYTRLRQFFTTRNERLLKQLQSTVIQINQLEPIWQALSDTELKAKTQVFRERLANHETLESLIPEVFATVREVSRRTLNMRHFDVQLIGGLVLHQGKIAEMRTGEGKTLVATLPVYLNALKGHGVHVVTVNDYLAKRDAEWMKPIYEFLGLRIGVIQAGLITQERQRAYAADVTYGTNNEFGFDYLRDNMVLNVSEKVQRGLHYALVDEVDSILIDEARTPLIISGQSQEDLGQVRLINQVIACLKPGKTEDFTIDEKAKQVYLTEAGYQRLEAQLRRTGLLKAGGSLYSADHINLMYYVSAALQAHYLFRRDVDYIVQANQIVIVDEHTGRLMPGRRWSGGVHQALEAKEQLAIQPESQTLARITFQNYFRLYNKLSGMTGTADTEAYELQTIYGLEVIVIPTYKPVRREDFPDKIYLSLAEKWEAIVLAVKDCWQRQQPVLVGTASIEHSEHLSRLLQRCGIPHQVLNAKRHEQEARIIAEAGRPKAVTIATNMAGRGTDIVLGGNLQAELAALQPNLDSEAITQHQLSFKARYEAVVKAGGLHIIGSSRHESRRIDNQLRGRSGRQGDPGSSQFYLSLQDDLLRIFAADRLGVFMQRLGMQRGESIEHPWVTNSIQKAQRKVEEHQFDIRKDLLEYDDVMNEQRRIIYQQREEILGTDHLSQIIEPLWKDVLTRVIQKYMALRTITDATLFADLVERLRTEFGVSLLSEEVLYDSYQKGMLTDTVVEAGLAAYGMKVEPLGMTKRQQLEKMIFLDTLDKLWKEQLGIMDHLRQQVRLRGFAQQNPKEEYKREAFELFKALLENLKYTVIRELSGVDSGKWLDSASPTDTMVDTGYQLIGRNNSCPCSSGKKFKHCHGRLQ